jgi:hypothetical protein
MSCFGGTLPKASEAAFKKILFRSTKGMVVLSTFDLGNSIDPEDETIDDAFV